MNASYTPEAHGALYPINAKECATGLRRQRPPQDLLSYRDGDESFRFRPNMPKSKDGATGWTGMDMSTPLSSGRYLFVCKNDVKQH